MGTAMDPHESIALIKANLAEVLNGEIIDHIIQTEKAAPKSLLGYRNHRPLSLRLLSRSPSCSPTSTATWTT